MAIEDFLKLAAQNAQSDPMAFSKSMSIGADIAQKRVQLQQQQDEIGLKQQQIQGQYEQRLIDMFKYLGDDKVPPAVRKLAIPYVNKLLVNTSNAPMSDDAVKLFNTDPELFKKMSRASVMMAQSAASGDQESVKAVMGSVTDLFSSSGSDLMLKYLNFDDTLNKYIGSISARNVGLKPEENIELKDATQLKSDAFKKLGEVSIGGKSGMDLFKQYLTDKSTQQGDQGKQFQDLLGIANGTLPQNMQSLPTMRMFAAEAQKVLANSKQVDEDLKELKTLTPDIRNALSDKYSSKISPEQKSLLQQAVSVRPVDLIGMDSGQRQKLVADARNTAYSVIGKQAVEARVSQQAESFRKEADSIYEKYSAQFDRIGKLASVFKNPDATGVQLIGPMKQALAEGINSVYREGDRYIYGAAGGIFDRVQNRIDDYVSGKNFNTSQLIENKKLADEFIKVTNAAYYSRLKPIVDDAKSNGVPLNRVIGEANVQRFKEGQKSYLEIKAMNFSENQLRTIEQMKESADKSGKSRSDVLKIVESNMNRKLNNAEKRYILSF